jgi:lipopolysaccharide export system permease protein
MGSLLRASSLHNLFRPCRGEPEIARNRGLSPPATIAPALRANETTPKFLATHRGSATIAGSFSMRIIDRYISRQVFTTAAFAVAVLSMVLVLLNVLKRLLDLLVNHDAPLQVILTFIAYIIPFSLTFTLPWGFLTAVLLVFGRLSAENELIALRSNGVSVPRICIPVFLLSLVCVAICFYINVDAAPKAEEQMKNAITQMATSNPLALFGADQPIDQFPGELIYVEKRNGPNLENILMYQLNDRGQATMMVHAKRGRLTADLQGKQEIILHLDDATYEQHDSQKPDNSALIQMGIKARQTDLAISLKELYEKNKRERRPSQMTLAELLQNEKPGSTASPGAISVLKTETNKRFSLALASFAFCLIGVPLAITAHRKETSIGFLFSLVVAFVYFFFIVMVDDVAGNPKFHPELLIWMPNVIFISLGAYLFFRMSRR